MLEYVFLLSFVSLIFAAFLAVYVLKKEPGSREMQKISDAVREGAEAFLNRQYKTIGIIAVAVAVLIFLAYYFLGRFDLGWRTSLAFLFGAFCSGLAGFVGMWVSIRTNIRTANAATKSLNEALRTALFGGAVSGITIVAMSLLGVALIFYLFSIGLDAKEVPFLIVGYGFGASLVALFAQLGGGIYTKGADVGADLVGKVEKNIPEDDPRNPAVIADLVGDNVGDCAGRGADLFESIAAENIGAMIIGVALYPVFGLKGMLFPLLMGAVGMIASIIGILFVRAKEDENPINALTRGYIITSLLVAVFMFFVTKYIFSSAEYPNAYLWYFGAGFIGIITSILILLITVYYTQTHRPVLSIVEASKTGHATNIITGFGMALECVAAPVIVLSSALFFAYKFGIWSGIPNGGIYGTAVATVGMLATAAYILAMDVFGPISDNAGGIIEMSNAPEAARKRAEKLDHAGNTTKALTKGYAIGSAALAAFLLFSAYLDEIRKFTGSVVVDLTKIDVFVAALIGAMLVFLFSSFAIRAVGITAEKVVIEVRRQFKEIKGLMQGKAKPDYAKCVDICTKSALRNMVLPGLLVVGLTVIVGVLLKAEATAAYLMSATISGIILALLMNTGGAAWDNAKKTIESYPKGKGTEQHKASVTGDTVGDPFKDTAGPSIHVLIKLLGTITLVLAPLFIL